MSLIKAELLKEQNNIINDTLNKLSVECKQRLKEVTEKLITVLWQSISFIES